MTHSLLKDAPRYVLNNGISHIHLNEISSTNTLLLDFASHVEQETIWLTCDVQTAGKGRSGRYWKSLKGNMYASILLIDPAPTDKLATLSFVSGLALYDALTNYTGDSNFALKWPNDVLLNHRKICGILLESRLLSNGSAAVVIGFGVNCVHHPELEANMLYPPTNLKAENLNHNKTELFPILVQMFHIRLKQWQRGDNLAQICSDWRGKAYGIGKALTVRYSDKQENGIFQDISEDGQLILRTSHEKKLISAADIFFK